MVLKRNNLEGMYTYLVGAMDRVPDGGVGWRQRITPALHNMGVKILNPCNKPVYGVVENDDTREIINRMKSTGRFEEIRKKYGNIRNADLRCVDKSDFVIAHIDMNVHMCGSYEEICTANQQKKPVLVWCEQGKAAAPNWLFFMLPHHYIFNSLESLLEYLLVVNYTEDVSTLDRWFFFRSVEE